MSTSNQRYEGSYTLPSSYNKDNYDKLIDLLNLYFKDNWCFNNDGVKFTGIELVIKFDRLTISNSRNRSHTINDLYVFLYINEQGILNTASIKGGRGKLSSSEYASNYKHSHLSGNVLKKTWFCTGNGHINEALANCCDEFNIDNFDILFANLLSFVEWESLEGVPFKYISNIKLNDGVSYLCIDQYLTRKIIEKLKKDDFDLSIRTNPTVVINQKFIDACVKNGCPLGYEADNGNWCTDISQQSSSNLLKTDFLFKNKKVICEITSDINDKEEIEKKPYIKQIENVARTIETRIKLERIKDSFYSSSEVSEFWKEIQISDFTRTEVDNRETMQRNFAY